MGRREYLIRLRCPAEGCRESSFSVCDTRKEEAEARAAYARSPWHCFRHRRPDEVLSVENPERHTVVVSEGKSYGCFWDGGSGVVSGPGFRAVADDFPPGTRLIITARIELPEDGEPR